MSASALVLPPTLPESPTRRPGPGAALLRVAIVADLLEERWPSMDLTADMLLRHLGAGAFPDIEAVRLRPPLVRRLTRVPGLPKRFKADLRDRVLNRFWDYPRWLQRVRDDFDVFHVIDHSYAHLVHVLPADRTVVTCHDTDAFLALVEPGRMASGLPKALARRIRTGIQKAARVACVSGVTCEELRRYRLLPDDRMVVVHNGVDPACSPLADEEADRAIARLVGVPDQGTVDLLHVGSTIPRKRVDLLLRIVAAVKEQQPRVRLLKAGGGFTDEQRDLLRSLRLEGDVVTLPFLESAELAALYRRAAVVLVTSEREGFGLPVIEAMACGTPVVATDIPVLCEVGGGAAVYAALGDVDGWRKAVLGLLEEERADSRLRDLGRRRRLEQASRFRWDRHAAAMAAIYRELSGRPGEGAVVS
jgi:glycosyltransferase involved in cell wall biosynthesis